MYNLPFGYLSWRFRPLGTNFCLTYFTLSLCPKIHGEVLRKSCTAQTSHPVKLGEELFLVHIKKLQ